jgi:hypothetical protein
MLTLKYIQIKYILGKYLQKQIHLHSFIEEELQNDNILEAYFKLTQINQMVANRTRNWFFPQFRHLISLCEPGRHTKWLESFKKPDLIEWWKINGEEVEKQLLTRLSNCVDSPDNGIGININKCQMSNKPMIKGTLLHEIYHKSICHSCIDAFQWTNDDKTSLTVLKSGRMISPVLPYIACTPDALVLRNMNKFFTDLKNPKIVSNNVVMTLELKTKFTQHVSFEEHKMALENPEYALQIFIEKLYTMELLFNENDIIDYNNLEMTINCKKRKSKTQPISYAFLSKKYSFMRQDHFEAICVTNKQNRKVTSKILPNLVLNKNTNDLTKHNALPDECNLSDIVSTGMGCLMIFNHEENEIVEYRMKKSPIILTLNSDYFNQTLEQHLVCCGYSNDSKAIFALGICLESSSKNIQEPKISMLYWYDTGITNESITRVSRVIERELFLVSKNISSMDGLFDVNIIEEEKEEERKKYLPKLLYDDDEDKKITSQNLFGNISDISTDSEEETDTGILIPKRKKSITIYKCTSNPNINWNRLKHLQIPTKSTGTKRSPQNYKENSLKKSAPSDLYTTEIINKKPDTFETPNLEYDKDLIFGSI